MGTFKVYSFFDTELASFSWNCFAGDKYHGENLMVMIPI